MNPPNPLIEYARLSQFIFHLYRGLGSQSNSSIVKQIPHLTPEFQTEIQSNLQSQDKKTYLLNPGPQYLLPNLERYTVILEDNRELTPFLLNDTIVFDLSTTIQHAPFCSLKDQIILLEPSLGQSIFIYLHSDRSDHEYAQSLITELVGTDFSLKSQGKLLGSPIWEYVVGDISYYLWLADNEQTISDESEGDYYPHLINMLCCRAKIEYAVRQAEECYRKGFECYNVIEARLDEISRLDADSEKRLEVCIRELPPSIRKKIEDTIDPQLSLPPQLQKLPHPSCRQLIRQEQAKRIEILEDHLKILPQRSYELARYERDLNTHLLTLNTNIDNFRKSAAKLTANKEDSFLVTFLEQDCSVYCQQIVKNIEVLSPGQRFADQFINSIRGIVELDSQKQQLELEEEEKEREKRLEKILATIGFGLGVSGIASQVVNKPVEGLVSVRVPKVNDIPPMGLWLLNIGIHVFLGLLASGLIWVVWSLGAKRQPQTTPLSPKRPQLRPPKLSIFSIPLKIPERQKTPIKKD